MTSRLREIVGQATRYGFVGVGGSLLDLAIFNIVLVVTDLAFGIYEPVLSKVLSTGLSAWVTYYAHRGWTFRNRARHDSEFVSLGVFAAITGAGLGLALGILSISHYVMGFTSLGANNLANIVAMVFAGAFRFVLTRTFVFPNSSTLRYQRRSEKVGG